MIPRTEYLYLLFDDSEHIALDKHVFNTEVRLNLFHDMVWSSSVERLYLGSHPPGLLPNIPDRFFNLIMKATYNMIYTCILHLVEWFACKKPGRVAA